MNQYLIEYWKNSDSWMITPMTRYMEKRRNQGQFISKSDYYYVTQNRYSNPGEAFSSSYDMIIDVISQIEGQERKIA